MIDKIKLYPLEEIDEVLVKFVKRGIRKNLNIFVKIGNPLKIPKGSYSAERKQFSSCKILNHVLDNDVVKTPAILVIDKDLYARSLNFVFGQADPVRKICIFSITRLKSSYYNLTRDEELLKKRSLKEAIHEIGHIYGLNHCKNPKCVMHFSNSLPHTDKKSCHFCTYHEKQFNNN